MTSSMDERLARAEARVSELDGEGAAVDSVELAEAYVDKGNALFQVGRTRDALSVYEQVITRFGASESVDVLEQVAWASRNTALGLRGLGEGDAASRAVKDLRERLKGQPDLRLRAVLLDSSVLQALLLFDEDRFEEGLAQLQAVVDEIPDPPPTPLLGPLARALTAQARKLTELGRYSEGLVISAAMLRRFRSSHDPDIREQVAQTLLAKADCLSEVGQEVAAIRTYTELLEGFSAAESPIFRRVLADALLERARSKLALGEDEEVAADIDRYIAEQWESVSSERRVRALSHKATAYINLDRLEEAMSLLDSILSWCDAEEDAGTWEGVANSVYNRGLILERMKRTADARAEYGELVRRFSQVEEPAVREIVSLADARLRTLNAEHD
jgi:tetratricopeptide (TPR) repeat protein